MRLAKRAAFQKAERCSRSRVMTAWFEQHLASYFSLQRLRFLGNRRPPSLETAPAAMQLFQRDWVLMNWALKFYDADHDILLEPGEAAAAAAEFRKLADTMETAG